MVLPILSSTAGILIALKAAAAGKELFMGAAKSLEALSEPLVKTAKTFVEQKVNPSKPPTPQKREEENQEQEQENRSRFIPTLKPPGN